MQYLDENYLKKVAVNRYNIDVQTFKELHDDIINYAKNVENNEKGEATIVDKQFRDSAAKVGASRRTSNVIGSAIDINKTRSSGAARSALITLKTKTQLQAKAVFGNQFANIGINSALFFIFLQTLVYSCLSSTTCYESFSENSNIGPSSTVIYDLGGCNINSIRDGEIIRLFWSMFMHSGWLHIGLNLAAQIEYLYILEPYFGFVRTVLVFILSGIIGNMFSAVFDPCKTSVGSSGGLFGLLGAVTVFCFEYYREIDHPKIMFVVVVFVSLVSIATSLSPTTATWAHIGGFIGGILVSCLTIKQLSFFGTVDIAFRRRTQNNRTLFEKLTSFVPRKWSLSLLLIRLVALLLLIFIFVYLLLRIFVYYKYVPLGSITWTRLIPCCCCDVPMDTGIKWFCYECNSNPFMNSDILWGDYCTINKN